MRGTFIEDNRLLSKIGKYVISYTDSNKKVYYFKSYEGGEVTWSRDLSEAFCFTNISNIVRKYLSVTRKVGAVVESVTKVMVLDEEQRKWAKRLRKVA